MHYPDPKNTINFPDEEFKKYHVTPREIGARHFDDLRQLMLKGTGDPNLEKKQDYNLGGTKLGKE